ITSVGWLRFRMTLAMANVLPEPVTPRRVCRLAPARRPSVSRAIAAGWSPAGVKGATSSNIGAKLRAAPQAVNEAAGPGRGRPRPQRAHGGNAAPKNLRARQLLPPLPKGEGGVRGKGRSKHQCACDRAPF